MTTLQEHFAKHFNRDDLAGAIQFVQKWKANGQEFTEAIANIEPGQILSFRTMAGHVSDYLEGRTGDEPESFGGRPFATYGTTLFGVHIYNALLSRPLH